MCLAPLFYLKTLDNNETKILVLHPARVDVFPFIM